MTADAKQVIRILVATVGLCSAVVALGCVRMAHGATPQVTYDNDGRQIARMAPAHSARHGKRAGRADRAARHRKPGRHVSMVGVVPELAVKARAIVAECGSTVVSAVARRGNKSNHPSGRAVDLTGNPTCIYRHLEAWPGGVSTDYWTAPGGPHVHVSYAPGGQEWGLRFKHARNPFVRSARALGSQEGHRY